MMLDRFLKDLIIAGSLTVIAPDGRCHRYGEGEIPGIEKAVVRVDRPSIMRKLALQPSLALGEAYMDGGVVVEEGGLYNFLALCLFNLGRARRSSMLGWSDRIGHLLSHRLMRNSQRRARRNVAHHYDLSGQLYQLFLDDDRQYSCAYFEQPDMSLEDAQQAKTQRIAAKLLLAPGQHILDIGCGWGGLALSLAQTADVRVVGITLSQEQLKVAQSRAEAAGLADRVSFQLCDYRDVAGPFDRIVSVGMFEHVGVGHYQTFFDKVTELLAEDGVALIHSIGRSDSPGVTDPWIRKYIFPGGYVPALSEVLPSVERAGAIVTDIEILRLHYAMTLREWRRRFLAHYDEARRLYDETFCRMWEFYLACCEAAFRFDNLMVFQMQIARSVDAVPLTRRYMSSPSERKGAAP
jgi:cyclopropane-fatty-acyl-phospholipid synthase